MRDSTSGHGGFIAPIALTVLGGFLGAGKTTLINHVIRHPCASGTAVLVNDFGAIDIDALLIVSRRFNTVSLANGCICCSIGGSLTRALLDISRWEPRPEQLIIETSGVADPAKVAAYGRIGRSYSLHGVTVLVDAECIRALHADPRLSETIAGQLTSAHLLVVNKCDRIESSERIALMRWLRGFCPSARMIETRYGALPAELVLRRFDTNAMVDHSEAGPAEMHPHGGRYVSWVYRDARPLCRDALERALNGADGLLRAKGMLTLADRPGYTFVLQLVGTCWDIRAAAAHEQVPACGTEIIFIGLRDVADPEHLDGQLSRAH